MQDWKQVIREHYAVAYDPTEFALSLHPPATLDQLEALERSLGFKFPDEWQSLYKTTNGFGVVPIKQPDFTSDLFPSIDLLPAFINNVQDWISPTHPDVATSFIPVLDFDNGDAIGYLRGDESHALHMFNHEACQDDTNQDSTDFLFPIEAETLQALLLP